MKFWDRLLRSLFVGSAVGLGWGIRGDFGHVIGAMAPGATLGMAFAYATGQRSMMKWMPIFAAAGAFFIGLGGQMSYAHLHGYSQSDTFINQSYGFFNLILQGGAWGGFAGAAIGLLMEKERVKAAHVVSALMTAYAFGWITNYLVVDLLKFDINPPRGNESIAFFGQIVGLFAWMILNKKWSGVRGLSLGFMGFGLGMSVCRLAGNAVRLMNADDMLKYRHVEIHNGFFGGHLPWFNINHWNVMETGCGLVGGLIFAFGMLGRPLPDPPQKGEGWSGASFWGILYVMGFIPLLHRIFDIQPARAVREWTERYVAAGFDAETAKKYADWSLLYGLDGVVVAGFVAAAIWLFLWKKDLVRWAAFPVLTFSLLILLFQNINCQYLLDKPPAEQRGHFVNMHTVFWILFGFMVLFTLAFELLWRRRDVIDPVRTMTVRQRDVLRWAFYPVWAFALLMLLYQAVDVYYLGLTHDENFNHAQSAQETFQSVMRFTGQDIAQHKLLWLVRLAVLLLPVPWLFVTRRASDEAETAEYLPLTRWIVTTLVIYVATVFATHYTNGANTMTTANKRWPLWAWKPESAQNVLRYERVRGVRLPDAIRGKPERRSGRGGFQNFFEE